MLILKFNNVLKEKSARDTDKPIRKKGLSGERDTSVPWPMTPKTSAKNPKCMICKLSDHKPTPAPIQR